MNKTVSELSKSARWALSALYAKGLKAGEMTIDVFEKLYQTLFKPVLSYISGLVSFQTTEKYR